MKYLQYVLGALLLCVYVIHADTTYVSGHITSSTVWGTSGSPYVITDDLYVDSSCILSIEPGVDVLFQRPGNLHSIIVNGHLIVEGTENDSITFSFTYDTLVDSSKPQWQSIKFNNPDDSMSVLKYCNIYQGKYNICCNNGEVKLNNSKIVMGEVKGEVCLGVYCWGHGCVELTNNTIKSGTGDAIQLEGYSSAMVKGNVFKNLDTGLNMWDASSAEIDSNYFVDNRKGIAIYNSSSTSEIKIRWNVFEGVRGMAIATQGTPGLVILHNNVVNNNFVTAGITIWYDGASANIRNNIFDGLVKSIFSITAFIMYK